jgi:thiol-disulfide isomerase/thioredoxin
MQYRKFVPVLFILTIILAACSQARPTSEVMRQEKPAEAVMAKGDMPEATADKMMEEKSKGMMDTATPDAMMEDKSKEMIDTATPDTMIDKSKDMMETATPEDMMDDKSTEMMETATPEMKDESMMAPTWFGMALSDVTTQESFTINDLKGKVILVETLAQWCPNCLQQQKQVLELHKLLGESSDFVSLGLDIDANEDSASLKAYIDKNGFAWRYAVAPADVSREIGNLYGSQFLNPSSTPMFIIDRHGEVHPLPFGIKSAEDLLEAIKPYLMDAE